MSGQPEPSSATVALAQYDPAWPEIFEQERASLAAAVQDPEISIVHIGSTAVAGLAAKPIVDILIEAPVLPTPPPSSWSREESSRSIAFARALEACGYHIGPDDGGRVRCFKQEPGCNLWIHLAGDLRAEALVLFRAYLRGHPDWLRAYEELKERLALEHPSDGAAYTQGKRAFVDRTLELAREAGPTKSG